MKRSGKLGRDPYYYGKLVDMTLAVIILFLALFIFLGEGRSVLTPISLLLGVVMSTLTGVMELSKGRRVIGYLCSVFAGLVAAALVLSVIVMW
jgi:hypothetical protein